MKKMSLILMIFTMLILVGCEDEIPVENEENTTEIIEISADDEISMSNLDNYLNRTDVQYVDLRNFEAKFRSGYIEGFESIPFFDFLDYRIFYRDDNFNFRPDQIINEALIRMIFDEEKAIFLYADGCIRSNYVKEVLDELGYERVFVLGGYYEYAGDYQVLGDGSYTLGSSVYEYQTFDDGTTYHVSVTYDMGRMILDIRFDITDIDGISYRSLNYSEIDYDAQLTILENFIVSNLTTGTLMYDKIVSSDYNEYKNIPGFTLGFTDELKILISKLGVN